MNKQVENIISRIKNESRRILGEKLVKMILFGSYARGSQEPYSDLDIMFLIDEEENIGKFEDKFTDISLKISLEHGIVPTIILKSWKQFKDYEDVFPFYMNVRNEGVVIYDRQRAS